MFNGTPCRQKWGRAIWTKGCTNVCQTSRLHGNPTNIDKSNEVENDIEGNITEGDEETTEFEEEELELWTKNWRIEESASEPVLKIRNKHGFKHTI